ncbi:MAG: dockerin type I domain-containing protein [Planctomycetota bacterium]|jgi:hypothetical protein
MSKELTVLILVAVLAGLFGSASAQADIGGPGQEGSGDLEAGGAAFDGTTTAGEGYDVDGGGPDCWSSPTQCHGDTDNDGNVKGSDFLALKNSWYACDADPNYDPCADFDRDGCVKGSDFLILKSNWYQTVEANCPPKLHLKVDLAHPAAQGSSEPRPGTAKEGWTDWTAPRWWDMYNHDFVTLENIDGSGVCAGISMAQEGNGGLKVYDMCMEQKTGGTPHGFPVGGAIANTWFYNIDWGGNPRGNLILSLYCLPAGAYRLTSYHNFWIFCSDVTRECTRCVPDMPPMPRVWAIGLIDAEYVHPHTDSWNKMRNAAELAGCLGNTGGVELLQDATDVAYTTTTNDDEVATSEISFRTDGSAVLVIYEAPYNWMDPRGRDGGRGILNAFELELTGP